jgi:hypothetical protein
MKKFEYLEVAGRLSEDELNEYGEKGWELSATIFPATPIGGAVYLFKREKVSPKRRSHIRIR